MSMNFSKVDLGSRIRHVCASKLSRFIHWWLFLSLNLLWPSTVISRFNKQRHRKRPLHDYHIVAHHINQVPHAHTIRKKNWHTQSSVQIGSRWNKIWDWHNFLAGRRICPISCTWELLGGKAELAADELGCPPLALCEDPGGPLSCTWWLPSRSIPMIT